MMKRKYLQVNHLKGAEWKLSLSESLLFSFLYTWGPCHTNHKIELYYSLYDIVESIPFVFKRIDTVYRNLKSLEKKGVIKLDKIDQKVYKVSITEKGSSW